MPARMQRLVLYILCLPLICGCRRPAPAPQPNVHNNAAAPLHDDLNRPWQGALGARRVISLAPSATEMICALGGRDRLVGIDTASNYPESIKTVERVGDFLRPSVERIVALRADVVVLASATITPAAAEEFSTRLQTPVFVLNPRRLPDIPREVHALAQLLGLDARGNAVTAAMEARFSRVRRAVAGRSRPRVFFEVWHEPLMTAGPRTVLDDLIRLAGGENVAAAQPKEFPTFSLEALLGADPDVYIITVEANGRLLAPEPAKRSGFSSLRAVRGGKVARVPADLVLRPTPRLAEGSEYLARAIHPEAFK